MSFGIQAHDLNTDGCQNFERIRRSVIGAVVHALDAAEVDETFGALNAREMRHEDVFFHCARGVAVDDGVLFGM